ncbi:type I polyketide synthase [Segniliparus rugosus]|uniref:Ketosynthase family 3 (KS3) domain-containing protein n=1 Tax=Segniliparus rugosus (strain ATCC BAA-974 / DSM 45345 / CCUG 50838 / CIP 108380 / JCM 13579 / CDC 945) TaxID=679197 RepID=U1N4F6_SEGRC|nr:type I polyketide synthase [Segniliparus rugosus]ERG69114.1 hypothetical protein HMPREF9336_04258 [Segniliparus rugosus ATCC BAA-974]
MDGAQPSERLALVGMACQVPGAPDVKSFWRMLLAEETAFGQIPPQRWDHALFFDPDGKAPNTAYTDVMAAMSDIERFDPLRFGISPRQAEVMDPQHRLLLTTVREALEDAGFDERSLAGRPVGVYVGVSTSDFRELITAPLRGVQLGSGAFGAKAQDDLRALTSSVPPARAFTMPGFLLNMAAATISRSFNLRGPSMAVDAACASSLVALHNAVLALRAGQCEVAIVAGVHVNLLPDSLVLFSKIGAVSKSGVCAPFDENADGFVLGEGVGAVVLTKEAFLPEQGEVHAWLRGVGCNNDGAGAGPMEPQAAGQRAAIEFALADSGVRAQDVDYIEAHGTATSVGDAAEVESLSASLPHRGALARYLGSAKANVGHAMSAAGVIGLIKAALVLRNGVVPPQPNVRAERSALRLGERGFAIARQSVPLPEVDRPHVAGVSAFGFGGTNVHVVLEAARPEQTARPCTSRVIPVRGANAGEIEFRCRRLLADIDASPDLDLDRVANTLVRREDRGVELLIVAGSTMELHERLRVALAQFDSANTAEPASAAGRIPAQISEDVWYRAAKPGAPKPKLCFLFAGQGSQTVRELAVLRALEPDVDQAVRRLAAASESPGLLDVMYPAERTPETARALASTDRCQPALLVTQLAMAGLLASVGVVPDVVLGHSVGEFAAAVAAGVLAPEAAVAFAARRGEAIAQADIPPGGMIACRADEATVRSIIADVPSAWVANLNAPDQTVVSGSSAGLAAAAEKLAAADVAVKALDVSHAFHSPLIEGANAQIAAWVETLRLADPRTAFVSCIDARPYRDAQDVRDVWRRHALAPVRFAEALDRARGGGQPEDMVFVQIGSGRALLQLARAAGVEPDRLLATGDTGPDHGRVLNRLRAQLRSLGFPVSLASSTDSSGALLSAPPAPAKPLWPVKQRRGGPDGATRRPAPAAQAPSAAAIPLSAPQQKEGPLVQEIVALWREQTALLEKMLGGQAASPDRTADLAQKAPVRPEPKPEEQARSALVRPEPSAAANGAQTLAEIARVGSYDVANLKPEQSLIGDLGFDSLMLAELFNSLKKSRPELSLHDLEARELTVARVVALAAGQAAAPATAAPEPPAAPAPSAAAPVARERGGRGLPRMAGARRAAAGPRGGRGREPLLHPARARR